MQRVFGGTLLLLSCLGACSSSESGVPEGSGGGAGVAGEAATVAGDAQGGQAELSGCDAQRATLEQQIAEKLDSAAEDPTVTGEPNFTLALETASGHRFVHSHGDSTLSTRYESASTSKWVAATVILDLVDRGTLALDDDPAKYLSFWQAKGVTLAQLLAFTSGFSKEPLCFNLAGANFADCVQKAYAANVDSAPAPGTQFYYSSTHLQIAGLMAVQAAGVAGFSDLFASWQEQTGLFPGSAFDLPSAANPRLAGGMHWTGEEYLAFLRALYHGQILSAEARSAMLESQRGDAKVESSPTLEALNQDWAYGFGNWLECPTAMGPDSYDCGSDNATPAPAPTARTPSSIGTSATSVSSRAKASSAPFAKATHCSKASPRTQRLGRQRATSDRGRLRSTRRAELGPSAATLLIVRSF